MTAQRVAGRVRALAPRLGTELAWLASRRGRADVALFHEFQRPPGGGGHQFLRALVRELASRGVEVERNRLSRGTPACLFNSFNFEFARLRRFAGFQTGLDLGDGLFRTLRSRWGGPPTGAAPGRLARGEDVFEELGRPLVAHGQVGR